MPDFLDKLKQGLEKGVTTVSVKSKELLDTNRVKSQIADLERQQRDALTELGTRVCVMLDAGHLDEAVLRSARATISGLEQQIATKQEALVRIHMEAQEALNAGPSQKDAAAGAHCTSCGAALAPGVKFCGSCGSKVTSS